jgi:hypothetical protein
VLIIGASSIASATGSSTSSQFEAGMYIVALSAFHHPGLFFVNSIQCADCQAPVSLQKSTALPP